MISTQLCEFSFLRSRYLYPIKHLVPAQYRANAGQYRPDVKAALKAGWVLSSTQSDNLDSTSICCSSIYARICLVSRIYVQQQLPFNTLKV